MCACSVYSSTLIKPMSILICVGKKPNDFKLRHKYVCLFAWLAELNRPAVMAGKLFLRQNNVDRYYINN